MAATVLFHV